ncbi:hypothetical protein [Corynebacterium anserum]|uniref:EcsC protein family protein n=1 Tax=Corynebacterium anserum TaxID=2684406 RepID=A0A7G7YP83_9CORY|nr:hypothetical protein [Corynebacterium anserum]QNH96303.1 hypothetical protein GP473_06175 [Corynebacterium anserum]
MGIFGFIKRKKNKAQNNDAPRDFSDLKDYPQGAVAGRFFSAVDRAASVQQPAIRSYVQKLNAKHSGKSVEERQSILDKHFHNLAVGTGTGTGGLAALPGIGTLASIGGIAGESVILLEACGLYALASAELHGIDVGDEQHRRALILTTISGASSNELVNALTQDGALTSAKSLRGLRNASGKELVTINSTLGRIAFKQMRKRFGGALLKKLLPFGVGAVLGARANKKIAEHMTEQVHRVIAELKHPTM